MTTRRGLFGYLAALGVVALVPSVPKIISPVKSIPLNGASATIPNTLGSALGFVMIKCHSKVGDWHMLELDDVPTALPAEFNEDGHSYITYQFGKKAIPQIQPYIDKLKAMQT